MSKTTTRCRRRFQFSLRTLLLAVLVLSLLLSWIAMRTQRARRQKEAIAAIQAAGGMVTYRHEYHHEPEPGPGWLRKLLPEDFYADVAVVSLNYATETDALLEQVGLLTDIEVFYAGRSDLTDRGMKSLARLRKLEELCLDDTLVTNAGLRHLDGMTSLRELFLTETSITDAGLLHLHGLNSLEWVDVSYSQVTPTGVKRLQDALPDCKISYRRQ